MSALYVLIGFSLLVALLFLWAFFWAMRNDQYADTHTPAMRILFDNDANAPTTTRSQDSSTSDGNTLTTTRSQNSSTNDGNTSTTTPLQDSSTEASQ